MYAFSSPAFWVRFFSEYRCHHCGSGEGYVSRPRTLFEKHGLRWMFLRTARCGDCYRRSYRPLSVSLLPRPEPVRFDARAMLLPSAERKVAQAETSAPAEKHQRIA